MGLTIVPVSTDDDAWEIAGNSHLMAYLMRAAMRNRSPPAGKLYLFIEAKRAWVADCRDISKNGAIDPEMQESIWLDYIESAERQAKL